MFILLNCGHKKSYFLICMNVHVINMLHQTQNEQLFNESIFEIFRAIHKNYYLLVITITIQTNGITI